MVRLHANGRNIVYQPLPTLLDVTCCVHLHTLLHVVVCCCAKFETGQTFQPTTPNTSFLLRDRRSVAQQCWIRLRSSSNIAGARTLITHGLQSLMGCILPTMHCRSQHCWELLHPFAHQCQHGRRGGDLFVFVGPGVGHLTDLVLPGEVIFESFFARRGDIWLPTWAKKTETEHLIPAHSRMRRTVW